MYQSFIQEWEQRQELKAKIHLVSIDFWEMERQLILRRKLFNIKKKKSKRKRKQLYKLIK